MDLPDLSIIIVNWNSTTWALESIASIYECTHGIVFEIIVVDNASPNNDVDCLSQMFQKVIVVKSNSNIGFSGANNLGFRHSTGRHILFLNPDTVVHDGAIAQMLSVLGGSSAAGIVGCRLLNADLTAQTSCIQAFPTILNQMLDAEPLRARWPHSRLWGMAPLFSAHLQPSKVEAISGACMMLKREVFGAIGMFSEDYFMYAEDVDLCYKAVRAGYTNWYIPDATVIHYGGQSSIPERATIMKWQSILLYVRKNRGLFYSLLFRTTMTFTAAARLLIIAALSVLNKTIGPTESGYSTAAKWKAILRTVVASPAARRSSSTTKVDRAVHKIL